MDPGVLLVPRHLLLNHWQHHRDYDNKDNIFFYSFTQDLGKELIEHADSEDSENNNFSLEDRIPLLKTFWNDASVQTIFDQRNLFYIDDSAK